MQTILKGDPARQMDKTNKQEDYCAVCGSAEEDGISFRIVMIEK